ncbi:hypothetical protein DGWBC_0652 [Dehalogenimonas sp. WBC-2]|nr:hypothetical protein DGWBC_0652 [Dehalogenimonas sp. WBC-2]
MQYIHQDSLNSTALVTAGNGTSLGTTAYYPYGATRSGSVPTDEKFTGQKLDSTGLYYYNARYYDPIIGRFISADTLVQNFTNPQTLNRYSYTSNNPLKYVDPTGRYWISDDGGGGTTTLVEPQPNSGSSDADLGLPMSSKEQVVPTKPEPSLAAQGLTGANGTSSVNAGTSATLTYSQAAKLADQYGGKPSEYINGTRTASDHPVGALVTSVITGVLAVGLFIGGAYLVSTGMGAIVGVGAIELGMELFATSGWFFAGSLCLTGASIASYKAGTGRKVGK